MPRSVLAQLQVGGPMLDVVTNVCPASGDPTRVFVQKRRFCFPRGTKIGTKFCKNTCGPSGSGCGPCRRWCGSGSGDGPPPDLGPCSGSGSGVGPCQTVCGPGTGLPARLWCTLSGGPVRHASFGGGTVETDYCGGLFDTLSSFPLDFDGETTLGGCGWQGQTQVGGSDSSHTFFVSLIGQPNPNGQGAPFWTVAWSWSCDGGGGRLTQWSTNTADNFVVCSPFHVRALLGDSTQTYDLSACGCPSLPFGCLDCFALIQCDITR